MEAALRLGRNFQIRSAASVQSLFTLIFFGSLSTFFIRFNINSHHHLDVMFDTVKSVRDSDDTFDFIIVGGGSAGAVVANRLSKENYKVLVLEAGGVHDTVQNIPAITFHLLNLQYIDWQYYTTPQEGACLAMKNKQCAWPRGKGLAGSDMLSFMLYMRGHRNDFESWANITNDPAWHYENLIPFFNKMEDYKGTWENEYHGKGGQIKISESPYTGMADYVVKAGKDLNYPEIDLNEADFGEGFSHNYQTQSFGYRYGVYNAYLRHARKRRNMFVYKFSHVTKILFRGRSRAYGVQYIRHAVQRTAFATKEVIVCAGAINSPQLLMLSGIGPREHLDSMGIPVKADLPVGKNLQDHVSTIVGPFIVEKPITTRVGRDFTPKEVLRFLTLGKGPMSSTGFHASGFLISDHSKSRGERKWPDIQYNFIGIAMSDKRQFAEYSRVFSIPEAVIKPFFEGVVNKDSFQIQTTVSRPSSRGTVQLESANPLSHPLVDPNYFGDEDHHDMKVLLEATKKAVDFVENSTTFQKMNGQLHETPFPPCAKVEFRSDAYWECYIRHYTTTKYHPVGTCAMGTLESGQSVVDSEFRVHGIDNLRVIDASVMPTIPTGDINGPTILIGEIGAQLIKNTWKR